MIFSANCTIGKASGLVEYKFNIDPKESKGFSFKVPCNTSIYSFQSESKTQESINLLSNFPYVNAKEQNNRYYLNIKKQLTHSTLPAPFTNFLEAQLHYLQTHMYQSTFQYGYYDNLNYSICDYLFYLTLLYKTSGTHFP